MAGKPVRCRLGLHSYVQEHPPEEGPRGPRGEVCRVCGKRRGAPGIPTSVLGG